MDTHSLPPPIPQHESGARAIEVAAMLGDSVVEVKHLTSTRGGTVSRTTVGLLAGGALCLVLSAISFAAGVKNAADNRRSLHQWVDVDQKSIVDYRPERLGLYHDWLAFGGALGGIACLAIGALRLRRERVSPTFRIGRAAGVDFATDLVDAESFTLVEPRGDEFVVRAAPGMTLEKMSGGDRVVVGEAAITGGARFRASYGEQTFLISSVPAPRVQPAPLFATWERSVLAFAGLSIAAHLGIVALLDTMAPDGRSLNDDGVGSEGRLTRIMSRPQEDVRPETEPGGSESSSTDGTEGAKMAGDEGVMGTKESKNPDGRFRMKKTAATPQLAHAEAVAQAQKAGILGVMNPHVFASLQGMADFSSGEDSIDIRGGLLGIEAREAAGGWGYGVKGVGPGGGCVVNCGIVGAGNFGLIGHRGTGGPGFGTPGAGGPLHRKHVVRGPQVEIGNSSSLGELDPNTIRRYVRRKLPQIRHCYERKLVSKQDLAGTVVAQFQISPMGVVQGAKVGGMGDGDVEDCVADAMRAIQFPKPRGGGFVNVRYPFTFQPAG
jgi:hypothetical protein